jgi:hypothetical protein
MPTYNGHKNYAHWNVSLWLHNDESLYRLMQDCLRRTRNRDEAAYCILNALSTDRTPDGVKWTFAAVRAALKG